MESKLRQKEIESLIKKYSRNGTLSEEVRNALGYIDLKRALEHAEIDPTYSDFETEEAILQLIEEIPINRYRVCCTPLSLFTERVAKRLVELNPKVKIIFERKNNDEDKPEKVKMLKKLGIPYFY